MLSIAIRHDFMLCASVTYLSLRVCGVNHVSFVASVASAFLCLPSIRCRIQVAGPRYFPAPTTIDVFLRPPFLLSRVTTAAISINQQRDELPSSSLASYTQTACEENTYANGMYMGTDDTVSGST